MNKYKITPETKSLHVAVKVRKEDFKAFKDVVGYRTNSTYGTCQSEACYYLTEAAGWDYEEDVCVPLLTFKEFMEHQEEELNLKVGDVVDFQSVFEYYIYPSNSKEFKNFDYTHGAIPPKSGEKATVLDIRGKEVLLEYICSTDKTVNLVFHIDSIKSIESSTSNNNYSKLPEHFVVKLGSDDTENAKVMKYISDLGDSNYYTFMKNIHDYRNFFFGFVGTQVDVNYYGGLNWYRSYKNFGNNKLPLFTINEFLNLINNKNSNYVNKNVIKKSSGSFLCRKSAEIKRGKRPTGTRVSVGRPARTISVRHQGNITSY